MKYSKDIVTSSMEWVKILKEFGFKMLPNWEAEKMGSRWVFQKDKLKVEYSTGALFEVRDKNSTQPLFSINSIYELNKRYLAKMNKNL